MTCECRSLYQGEWSSDTADYDRCVNRISSSIRVYSCGFTLYVLVSSCMLYSVVVFQIAPCFRPPCFRLTKCVIGIAEGCTR